MSWCKQSCIRRELVGGCIWRKLGWDKKGQYPSLFIYRFESAIQYRHQWTDVPAPRWSLFVLCSDDNDPALRFLVGPTAVHSLYDQQIGASCLLEAYWSLFRRFWQDSRSQFSLPVSIISLELFSRLHPSPTIIHPKIRSTRSHSFTDVMKIYSNVQPSPHHHMIGRILSVSSLL